MRLETQFRPRFHVSYYLTALVRKPTLLLSKITFQCWCEILLWFTVAAGGGGLIWQHAERTNRGWLSFPGRTRYHPSNTQRTNEIVLARVSVQWVMISCRLSFQSDDHGKSKKMKWSANRVNSITSPPRRTYPIRAINSRSLTLILHWNRVSRFFEKFTVGRELGSELSSSIKSHDSARV